MKAKKQNRTTESILSNVYFVILFAGYSFYTSLLSFVISDVSESRGLTLPYRILEILLAGLLLLMTIKKKAFSTVQIKVLWMFWLMIFGRFIYDILRLENPFLTGWKIDTFSYMLPMTMLPMLIFQKIHININFEKTLFWVYGLLSIAVLMSFVNTPELMYATDVQLKASNSSGVIATGHLGLTVLILTVFIFKKYRIAGIRKICMLFMAVLSTFIFLRSGSRGPILSSFVVGSVALLSISRNKTKSLMWLFVVGVILFALSEYFIEGIRLISPVLVDRFERKMDNGGQLNDRVELYVWAWNEFTQHPLIGSAFAIYTFMFSDIGVSYTHNVFLETLMQTGVIGGVLFIYIYIKAITAEIKLLVMKHPAAWVGLIMVQMMTKVMVSSAFYLTPTISLGMVIVFLSSNKFSNKIQNGKPM